MTENATTGILSSRAEAGVVGGTSAPATIPRLDCLEHPAGPYVRLDGARCRDCGHEWQRVHAYMDTPLLAFPVEACATCVRQVEHVCICGSGAQDFFVEMPR